MSVTHIRPSARTVGARKTPAGSSMRDPLRGLKWTTCIFILFTVGRVVDIVPGLSALPLVKVILVIIAFLLLTHRNLLPNVFTPDNSAVKWAMAFAVWVVISLSFSIWPGRSASYIVWQSPVLFALVLAICKVAHDWHTLRRLFLMLVFSALILTIPGLLSYGGGRLSVESQYDTNELAYVLVGILPLTVAFGLTAQSKARRIACLGAALPIVLTVMLTGSRGGTLGLVAVAAFVVLDLGKLHLRPKAAGRFPSPKPKSGAATRIFVSLLACALIGAIVWPKLPQETRERLSSLVNLSADYNLSPDPNNLGRVQIWQRGIKALADRPIGFGIGAYPMMDWKYGGKFYTAHNSVVLVLVELGPVGFVIYMVLLWKLWRGLSAIRRTLNQLKEPTESQQQQAIFSRMLQGGLIGNFVAGLFLSATYFYAHWANIALAMAFIALFNREQTGSGLERDKTSRS